ncbi:TylF/MycF/NovP-related O-methyltransferase [Bradyrhizobium zhanjiangense]|uniref:TylF/MycF/NovP-related O-methyltransferase n=1 Tax=Bradyrhizobium zhanjiangense TaxID=1325107 RepID=UPI001008BEC0|nr:TylF/MycF/NovP-related O-methyltransferase [Bradyrhizobium zhanjiangense]
MSRMLLQPLVSVVIPVYNGANFLADAVQSALNQTYRNIEIIVVNDGSTDHGATREVALSFGERIRYFEKENGGCGSAFNWGIRQMRGDYFSWLSHDDAYDPTKIERQIEVVSAGIGAPKVACCSYRVLDDSTGRISPQHYYDVEEFGSKPLYGLFRGAINGNCLLIPSKAFNEIGLFDESLRTTQDYDLFYRLLRRFSIVYHDDVLVTARVHPQQDTLAKHDLAMRESDQLWSRFIDDASSIGVFSYEHSPAEYWAKLANHLWQSPYPAAREKVFSELRLAIDSQVPRPQEQPLVSVIVPFLRVDSLLLSAVKSVVEQTYANLEVLLAANARLSDEALHEVHSIARTHGRELKVVDASARRGASYARNCGLDAANGEYIALLDADDFWHPKKIDYQVAAILGFDCKAVSTAYSQNALDIKDFTPKQKLFYSSRDYLLTLDRIFPTPSFMFKATDARFNENMHICEDMDFFSKLIGDGLFFELPFRLSVINIKPAYAWNVADAYAARMGVCMARGVSQLGDEFETSLFLTMCRVAVSRGQTSDLRFVAHNWRRIVSLMPRQYVAEKFIRHVVRKVPGATAVAAQLRRARYFIRAQAGFARRLFSRARHAIYRALVPRSIEQQIVLTSPEYRALAAHLEQVLGEQQATRTVQLDQIARLEQDVVAHQATRAAHVERIASLETQLAEQQNAHRADVGQIARLEQIAMEHRALRAADLEQIAKLEKMVADNQATHTAHVGQIARLEQAILEYQASAAAHVKTIAVLEKSLAERQESQIAHIERIARLEQSVEEHSVTRTAHFQQIALLVQAASDHKLEVARLREGQAALLDENSALKGQAAALHIANSNQSALITGRLSLLEYQLRSLIKPTLVGKSVGTIGRAYLDLLESALVGLLTEDPAASPWSDPKFDPNIRMIGRDWPKQALTMIGVVRMRNLRSLLERVIDEGVPGDVIETGVWRGGACIYMRGILAARDAVGRTVWVADSFRGLPPPDDEAFPEDRGDKHYSFDALAVPLDEVKQNFHRYGLLDDQVRFLEGWFKDTLPSAPIERLALLRLDGDMYESTIQALDALYGKLSPGGFVIVDDYILEPCRKAVDDFRAKHGIASRLEPVDGAAVFWRKAATEGNDMPAPLPAGDAKDRQHA